MCASQHCLLVLARGAGLLRSDESCADPHAIRSVAKSSGETLTPVDASCSDYEDLFAGQGTFVSSRDIDYSWSQNGEGNVARVTPSFSALEDDHVYSTGNAAFDMLGVTNDACANNSSFVQLLDDFFWCYTNGRTAAYGGIDVSLQSRDRARKRD